MKGYATWISFKGPNYVMRYKLRDNAAKGKFYEYKLYGEFKPTSIRATGNGFVTNKINTPTDLSDTILIQYKVAKTSSDSLVNEIKDAVLEHLDTLGITADSIVTIGSDRAKIKATKDNVSKVKAIVDVHITAAHGVIIAII